MSTPNGSEFELLKGTTRPDLLCRTTPFDKSLLDGTNFDADNVAYVEMMPNDELYKLMVDFIIKGSDNVRSFSLNVGRKGRCGGSDCDSDEDENSDDVSRVAHKGLGLGLFPFDYAGARLMALHSTLGDVVGSDCGATLMKSLIIIAESIDIITGLADALLAKADVTSDLHFTCYRWHVEYQYWRREETASARPIESVVLPAETKKTLVTDLDDFVSDGTRKFYSRHGVPYKRSYLLHGSPGAGKTSLIQAIAGRYKRNIAILTPSHPKLDDEGLKSAVQRIPPRSIIVLEDIDACFSGADGPRSKSNTDKSSVTFSGMLNALDGVGGCAGQIFILTTNHKERLDPALIRCGRVDVHIEFKDATREQAIELFKQFYPEAEADLSTRFGVGLFKLLAEKNNMSVSMAQLQHYFIKMRKETADVAAERFCRVIEDVEKNALEGSDKEKAQTTDEDCAKDEEKNGLKGEKGKKKKAATRDKKDQEEKDEEEENSEEEGKGKTGKGKGHMHVHVHIH